MQAFTSSGRVRASKSMSETQMRATIKATKNFLSNPFSTKSGTKRAKAKAMQTLKERFGVDTDITDDEVESLTNFFDDSDVNKSTNYVER